MSNHIKNSKSEFFKPSPKYTYPNVYSLLYEIYPGHIKFLTVIYYIIL